MSATEKSVEKSPRPDRDRPSPCWHSIVYIAVTARIGPAARANQRLRQYRPAMSMSPHKFTPSAARVNISPKCCIRRYGG